MSPEMTFLERSQNHKSQLVCDHILVRSFLAYLFCIPTIRLGWVCPIFENLALKPLGLSSRSWMKDEKDKMPTKMMKFISRLCHVQTMNHLTASCHMGSLHILGALCLSCFFIAELASWPSYNACVHMGIVTFHPYLYSLILPPWLLFHPDESHT